MEETNGSTDDAILVLWRPGCGFSAILRRGLDRAGLAYEARNIWDDPEAAAMVRRVTGGAETVPTVLVADRAMVNPTATQVLLAVQDVAHGRLPADWEPPPVGRVGRLLTRLLGG